MVPASVGADGRGGIMDDAMGIDGAVSRMQANIPVGPGLHGDLAVPREAIGVAVFAHGSGSSRFSPRNRLVANALNGRGIATLLFDLLTTSEEPQRANVFDVELLGGRLEQTTRWLLEQPLAKGLAPCYFGASTGAAAALAAAAELGPIVRGVVSRGGRPDLAGERLRQVTAPTLLIVGGHDETVLDLNRQAYAQLTCERQLVVVRRAGHLFEEPGTLERVAELTGDWLTSHLGGVAGNDDLGERVVEPLGVAADVTRASG
jgi:putative phosphoribosyl transferase